MLQYSLQPGFSANSIISLRFPLRQSAYKNRARWSDRGANARSVCVRILKFKKLRSNRQLLKLFKLSVAVKSKMGDETYQVYTRMEEITEQEDRHLAGAKKEIRNELTVIIPENPFPEIEVDAYPPLKFSWVIPKKLAAMAFPRNKENLKFLTNQGITHLVTLTAGKKPPVDDIPRLRWSEVPIEEFELPTVDDIKKFIDVCKRAEKNGEVMGVHCRQGRSRSGVMLACYLVHFHRFLPDQAMNVIRMIRPGSLDFEENEESVGRYFQYLTEDNPLKFGVSGDVMEEFIETAKEATKKVLA